MKKLSFSLSSSSNNSSKPSKSTSQNQSTKKEFITEYNPSKTLPNSTSKPPFIIPPIPNEWKPQKKTANSDDLNVEFEVKPNSTMQEFDSNIINGLNFREKKGSGSESSNLIDRLMLKNLKRDLEKLPEDRGLEEFDDVSVEEFGSALLKGYGWYEGRGIGKDAKEDVKVVQYTKWNGKEGLGFVERVWMI